MSEPSYEELKAQLEQAQNSWAQKRAALSIFA